MGFYVQRPVASARRIPTRPNSRPRVYPKPHTRGTALQGSGSRLYEPGLEPEKVSSNGNRA